ncbi:hypothetical protein [Nocardioides speluncae]|uniref:hypothetical protein n=1 Tax=Nocardioides speluncae TaxID=2670337 RepID=UPI000D692D54|nr:hypothetical protein [Nocardioides speluncae]
MEQLPSQDDNLTATFYCKDPDSEGFDDCETFYTTDRDSWLVQGKRRGPAVAEQLVGLADDETFVEISGRTAAAFARKYVKEHYGVDLG